MDICPVRSTKIPGYPTRDYLNQHPELLAVVPARWRRNPLVMRVLGGVAGLLLTAQAESAGRVAPLFPHGEGRGSFGCVAVSPPVFLTEDEARKVILEEAKSAGLTFELDALKLPGVEVPETDTQDWRGEGSFERYKRRDLVLDGFDRKRKVAFEFVSAHDVKEWERKDLPMRSSVSSYDVKQTAERLRAKLAATRQDHWIAVFYEPATGRADLRHDLKPRPWEEVRAKAANVDAEDLRLQVRDFIAWLHAQGVL